jgi:hypothetical protein
MSDRFPRLAPSSMNRLASNRRQFRGAIQILLGHTKIDSTVRYLGVEVDDALALSEQTDV